MTQTLGDVLRELRATRGWTQGQLAYKAGTAPEYISMLENGVKDNPSADLLARITVALDATPDYVLGRIGSIPADKEPVPPEVQRVVHILSDWPETTLKRNARDVIITVAEMLEQIRKMDADAGAPGVNLSSAF
jgi:transcriptional regulator with XRE-family HTH domain